jgi:hypothetical protein
MQPFLSTENTTLVIVLLFVLLVLGMLLLPAASFIQLVGLIRKNGSEVAAAKQEIQRLQTILLSDPASGSKSNPTPDTLITPASPDIPLISSTPETE